MSAVRSIARALVAVALLATCGCIPRGGDPAEAPEVHALSASAGARAKLGSLGVAQVSTLSLARDEAAKGWKLAECTTEISRPRIQADLTKALQASGLYERVHATSVEARAEAWREKDELLVTVSLENLATRYEGHNLLWIPNMLNWLFWIVPSWFVPTEEYSLSVDAEVSLQSAESGAPVAPPRTFTVTASGTFDELDRGWQFFGFISPRLDAEVWRTVATKLFPKLQLDLAVETARAAADTLRTATDTTALKEARRKTLALVVGVTSYEQAIQLPPLPFAAEDARNVAEALARAGLPREHVVTLTDETATVANLREKVQEHLGRAREGDSVLVYFAGYGTRGPDGSPALVFHEAQGTEAGRLSLDELAKLLEPLQGAKLVVVDAAFGGRERSVRGGPAPNDADSDLAPFARANVGAILAGGASDPALAPEHLGSGLLGYHLVLGLRGAADEDRDGRFTAQEIFRYLRPHVLAEAALAGERQEPRASGLDHGFAIGAPGGAR